MSQAPPAAGFDVHALRAAEFPHVGASPYLNAASVGPLPERSRRATDAYNLRRSRVHELADDDFEPTLRRCREAAARLVSAAAEDIALVPNTSFGINLAAAILPVAQGQRVLASAREFPANVYPWMGLAQREGVRFDLVPADEKGNPDEDRILVELDRGDVAIFALSAVQFATGWNADLPKLGRFCRERGIRFVVDAIQALGQVPLDVREAEVDVLATGGHKWLLGPFGAGFAYVRPELYAQAEPNVVGWTAMAATVDYSRVVDYRWRFLPGARRYEVATLPQQDIAGLTESVDLLLETGIENVRDHVLGILDPLIDWLAEREVQIVSDLRRERRSGIFCFKPKDLPRTMRALHAAGVVCVPREGAVRLAPHVYNTAEEIGAVIEVLRGAEVA
ncbi:MAG TPA: aminotransferase class V-fold PLP-dependent enzyme [Longimicrobiaceae bacterium]|jgi:selenocysteine lyase/cysteine desulfurase|nr:aminotransferase class V-fold PLP-dependent enzyme [Longimicrobiaceae bacterium]